MAERDGERDPGAEEVVRLRDRIRAAWTPAQEYRRARGQTGHHVVRVAEFLMRQSTVRIPRAHDPTRERHSHAEEE
jgi:hypothetical protein